ncbi:MAG: hypothetical protein AB7G28_08065 [Pirellulales bacterium]
MTRRTFGTGVAWIAVAAMAWAIGCGEGHPKTYPVEGLLRFEDGRPVTFGTVEFHSPAERLTARGKLDAHGHFRLTTFAEGDGAVAGEHQVVVIQNVSPAAWQQNAAHAQQAHSVHGPHDGHHAALVSRRYADYATSGLKATVEAANANRVMLQVSR